jgi:hypothetical protein
MKEIMKSEGKCYFCGKMFAKSGINRHLNGHLNDIAKTGEAGSSFLVKVGTSKRWGATPYFLSLWVDGDTKLETIDAFLRAIWLECCGHMSAVMDPTFDGRKVDISDVVNQYYDDETNEEGEDDKDDEGDDDDGDFFGDLWDDYEEDIPMGLQAGKLFTKGFALNYEYDFGSSTNLTLEVVSEYPIKAEKDIVLLSRNEPLSMICSSCGKAAATQICMACIYDEASYFCDKCARKHAKKCEEFDDYASMPIVNSPRMGVCGYTGGTIDIERDGVYQKE